MIKKSKKNTASDTLAVNEIITPIQLLQELAPLLQDYFIGDFKVKNNAIDMSFENGQSFRLVIGEVV